MNNNTSPTTSRPCRFCGRLIGGAASAALTRHERTYHRAAFDAAINAAIDARMAEKK